jgi:hypothetical protein
MPEPGGLENALKPARLGFRVQFQEMSKTWAAIQAPSSS